MSKKSIAFIIILQSLFSASYAQWEWLNPKPTGYTCNKIIFTDTQKGFILNSNNDLIVTTDQGNNWNIQQNFPDAITMDIKDSTGVIVGYNGTVYVSTDNGNSWQKKTSGISDYFLMADIVSRDTIFLANNNGKIYRSDDRGNTWKTFTCGIQLSSIEFINSKVGYAGGTSTYILKTEDGGVTWQQNVTVNHYPSNTLTIKFYDINTGFAFREHSDLLSTTDGGKTWKQYNMGDDIYSFSFISKTVGFASGEYGVTYRTDDGGITWKWISFTGRTGTYNLNSVYFLSSNIGFTVGSRGRILKTTDGGLTWNTYSPTYIDVSDISVPTNNTAYATVGNTIFKTTDSGRIWKQLPLTVGTNYGDYDVFQTCHFFNADTGFVTASDNARIYKTYDGGSNWKLISPTQYSYDDVTCLQFINKNTGFLAINIYYGGTIVKTKDGGETWTPVWSSQFYGEVFDKIYFTDERTGYASRYERLYKTEDSAKTWKELWREEFNDISAIWFISPKTGFVAGENGMLKRTNDSGKTWSRIEIAKQYYDDIYSLKFLTEKVGYLSAENGAIYKTIDGGNTWKQNNKGYLSRVNTIVYAPDSSVYLAGEYGSILRSDVREYRVDSFTINTTNNCNAIFRSVITAVLSSVDSMSIEYGINTYDQVIAVNPSSVNNNQQVIQVSASNLVPSTNYKVRLKVFYKNQYYYHEYTFRTPDRPSTPLITASGSTTFCQGDSITLTSSATTGNQWYLNGVAITRATNQSFTTSQPGKYQVVRTIDCYSSDTASIIVIVNAIPPKPGITASGDILTSSSTTGNQWYLNGVVIPGETNQQHTAASSGAYTVRVTENNCVGPFSDTLQFLASGRAQNLFTYPNPVTKELIVRNSAGEKMSIRIMDGAGNIVYSAESSTSSITINMSRLSSGNYFVIVRFLGSNEQSVKMILKK